MPLSKPYSVAIGLQASVSTLLFWVRTISIGRVIVQLNHSQRLFSVDSTLSDDNGDIPNLVGHAFDMPVDAVS